jgi:V/A-type H+/Na+-transporting ATPase subunit F
VEAEGAGGGRTAVIGERELAIGFRLIGLRDVFEISSENAVTEFQRLMANEEYSLVVASETVRRALTESQQAQAEASLRPLVVFVPSPTGEYNVESLATLAKRVLGVSLQV